MSSTSSSLADASDAFRLHYVRETQRCVVSYDTLDEALEGASKRIEKHPDLQVWITTAAKTAVLDDSQIRKRLAEPNRGHGALTQIVSRQALAGLAQPMRVQA